ncbi:bifunctional lysylphosphatidylglycerol flippase/synthetase MprF [Paracoccus spongiarum]|uniref:bifunctional lysylphosphatidylglycerol flippase/synthetase MprF n=1 Tax=Paracoccus spongiarum TaxID=3064387 RepID=UPI0035327304
MPIPAPVPGPAPVSRPDPAAPDADRLDASAPARRSRLRDLLPYLLAAALFGLGLYALHRLLAPVDLLAVAGQIRATPWPMIAMSVAATLAGYLCLAGYDWSALRHIGRPLPAPVVLTGGLMAYAFGNTIGLTALTGGAVRWRFYAGLGLSGLDIAAVSAFAAASFGIAATLVGLLALAAHPDALAPILPLSPGLLRGLAIAACLAITLPLLLASISGRCLRLGPFRMRAPSPGLLAGQLLFGIGDVCLSALALYVLLPGDLPDFLTFLAIFAAATMAGVVSHVPGGVGVFETVLIAALPAGAPIGSIAAALLLFRLIYYLLPFAIALASLSAFEAWRLLGRGGGARRAARALAATEPAFRAIQPLAPMLLAVMVFGAGLLMSGSSLLPPLTRAAETAETFLPLALIEGSALLGSALGALLILLSLGLARRSLGAWTLTLLAMGLGAGMALFQGQETGQAAAMLAGLAMLLPFRPAFHRRSMLTHAALTPGWIVLMIAAIVGLGFVLFFAHKGTPYVNELWWQFAADERAPRALRSGLLASMVIALAALYLLLRAPRFRPAPPGPEELARAEAILRRGTSPLAGFALTGDKTILLSDDGQAFVMFGTAGSSWIAYGAAVGEPAAAQEVGFDFVDAARRAGARPVFYEIGPESVPQMLDLGMTLHKMGEEAVIDLTAFSLDGPSRKRLRTSHARAGRDGLSLDLHLPPHDDALFAEIGPVSSAWLDGKRAQEKGFSVGRYSRAWLDRWPVAVVRRHGRVVAFANVLVTDLPDRAALDLMRHVPDAPSGTMEFLFTALILRLRELGYRSFSLGMAPLSGLAPDRSRRLWDRFGALVYRHGGSFYNFEGLRAFKAKFDPAWVPRYLATATGMPPLLPLADAARLIARGGPSGDGGQPGATGLASLSRAVSQRLDNRRQRVRTSGLWGRSSVGRAHRSQ